MVRRGCRCRPCSSTCAVGATQLQSPGRAGVVEGDGRDRPLVLRLSTQVDAHGLERGLDSPASQEPGHDRMELAGTVGRYRAGHGCSDSGRDGSGASCWSVFQ